MHHVTLNSPHQHICTNVCLISNKTRIIFNLLDSEPMSKLLIETNWITGEHDRNTHTDIQCEGWRSGAAVPPRR